MGDKLNDATLAALKARSLPHCTGRDMLKAGDGGDPAEAERLMKIADDYFHAFLAPGQSPRKCVCCGGVLTGLFGSFMWGLMHGEGQCSECGYPARAIHTIDSIGKISGFVLQYHPDDLEFPKEQKAEG